MKAFIQDRERVLDSANDLLKTSVYADNLVKVIENTPKNKVFTIGVFGGWGTGKSSIIRTTQERLRVHTRMSSSSLMMLGNTPTIHSVGCSSLRYSRN